MRYICKILICFLLFSCTPKTEIERYRGDCLKTDLIFKGVYDGVKKITDDTGITYENLFLIKDNKRSVLIDLRTYAFTKSDSIGLKVLMYGDLSENQKKAILLFYEPFSDYTEIANEIIKIENPTKLSDFNEVNEKIQKLKSLDRNQFDEYFNKK